MWYQYDLKWDDVGCTTKEAAVYEVKREGLVNECFEGIHKCDESAICTDLMIGM